MKNTIKTLSTRIAMFALIVQLVGCGTFMYPERQGQPKGDIDPTVAILDGVGLLFFIVPGLVAFIVDFHTGAVYLPPGKSTEQRIKELKGSDIRLLNEGGKIVVHFDPKDITPVKLEKVIHEVTGIDFDSSNPELVVYKIDKSSKFFMQIKHFASSNGGSTLVFN